VIGSDHVPDRRLQISRDTYVDSVGLLNVSRDMRGVSGVVRADALMATSANLELLQEAGFDTAEADAPRANDLVLAVVAESAEAATEALRVARDALHGAASTADTQTDTAAVPRSLDEAIAAHSDVNLAVISVPGSYAALETHRALTAGLHVLLFSDNVPVSEEVELKRRAAEHGLLVMGPGAGTALLGGVSLGFANVVRDGPVRIVAAAGTGAQEAMVLLHHWGAGVSDVIGVGGRDLSREVQATMTRLAIAAEPTREEVLLLVSKPPDPDVAATVLRALEGRRAVCAFVGLERALDAPQGVRVAATLEGAVLETLASLGADLPQVGVGLADSVVEATARLGADRRAVRGVFSGGTLCYEAMVVLANRLGAVYSNTPLRPDWSLPSPGGAHVCLDLGEEEYTRNRPHPMIDPRARADEIERAAADPATAVLLIDVVLGHGSHPNPAEEIAKVIGPIMNSADRPVVIAYVLGTELDPQSAPDQRARLEEAGCILAPTNARAALLAAAVASRRPELAEETP
jgi:FdrA protein